MDYFIQTFGGMSFATVIVFIAAIAFLVGIGIKLYKIIVAVHDKLQEKDETIKKVADSLSNIQEQQKLMTADVIKLFNKQEELCARQNNFEQNWNVYNLTKMKDSLLQSYRYYCNPKKNPMQAWTELEKEVFENIFSDYEQLGGNGFMHSVVQPEMTKLDVIPMSNEQKVQQLHMSRMN